MKVKTGFSKEEKVKACEKYHSGKYSYGSIAKEIGCSRESVPRRIKIGTNEKLKAVK